MMLSEGLVISRNFVCVVFLCEAHRFAAENRAKLSADSTVLFTTNITWTNFMTRSS